MKSAEPNLPNDPPWDDPSDIAVVTTQEILDGRLPILLVIRDPGPGGWQFLDGEPLEGRDPVAIAKPDLLQLDPRLVEVTNLPVGWFAEREQPGAPWRRARSSGGDEEQSNSNDALSPEADKFLAEACEEHEDKQRAFEKQWRFDSIRQWGFDQDTGILSLSL